MTAIPLLPDLHQRREMLFRVHSLLRSIDNLRPDEALDEVVNLFAAWAKGCEPTLEGIRKARPDCRLSLRAAESAAASLWPLFESTTRGGAGDLFQEIADAGVRSGMGQYFTPLPVAHAMAEFLAPAPGEHWLDPFCGSGLLLGELAHAGGDIRLYGLDRDQRVLHLAALESQIHHPETPTRLLRANALSEASSLREALAAPSQGFDGVVTNPPFGAEVHEADRAEYAPFDLAYPRNGTPLEILGLEQSVRMLRPGGRLGIVLPQSVLSNRRGRVREWLTEKCRLDGVLSLPADTFAPFQGVGKAAVLFATRRDRRRRSAVAVTMGIARSVGYDATGRATGITDVHVVARAMRDLSGHDSVGVVTSETELERNLTPEWHLRAVATQGRPIRHLTTALFAGRTPARSAYLSADETMALVRNDDVYRVLKVGDLSGSGIDWTLGARSCVRLKRRPDSKMIQLGDIVTTAAAHHPRYIGAKVDIVDELPLEFGDRVFPCAELLVIRPDISEVDPFAVLLWLRTAEGRAAIQACVTGQTAHLHPEEVGEIVLPSSVLGADVREARQALEESLRLRRASEQALERAVRTFSALT